MWRDVSKLFALVLATQLLVACGPVRAQIFGPPPRAAPAGAGKSPADVICADPDTKLFCQAIQSARRDPSVAELLDPTFTGTIFVPTDKAFEASKSRLVRHMAVSSLETLLANPTASARLVREHFVIGQALQDSQLVNDQKLRSSLGDSLKIDTGLLWGKYIEGPNNKVKFLETNIQGGRSYIHKIDGVLIPKR